MQIFIARGEEQHGPYPLEQAKDLLAKGVLKPGDYAYHEGLSDWTPLLEVILANSEPEASPAPSVGPSLSTASTPKAKSKASPVIAIVVGLMVLGGLAAAGGWYFFLRDEPMELVKTTPPLKVNVPPNKEVEKILARETGIWKITGHRLPVIDPETGGPGKAEDIRDTIETRWKEKGKSTVSTFSPVINGKKVSFVGYKEYDAKDGVFIWRVKGEGLPETVSKERYDPVTKTFHGEVNNQNNSRELSTFRTINKDRFHFKSKTFDADNKLLGTSEMLFTRLEKKEPAQPPMTAGSLTAKEAAEVMAWVIGKWETKGKGMPVGGEPQAIEMTMEARWKEEGKSVEFKYTMEEGGKTVSYFGHQKYDEARGIFIYRSKWGDNPEATSHERYDPATRTSRAQSIPASTAIGSKTTTVTKRIGQDKTQQTLEVFQDGQLVYSHEIVSTRIGRHIEPAPHALQKGLVAYYPFNGNARDEAGHGHDGTVVGARLTADRHGRAGSAYQFKLGDHIRIKGLMGKPKNVTLAAWVKLNGQQGRSGADIISIGTSVNIRVDSKSGTGGSSRTGRSSWSHLEAKASYTDTGWHQIVLTFNDNTDRKVVYVDGTSMAASRNQISIFYEGRETDTVVGINGRDRNAGFETQGVIDDIRIYDRALSAREVKALFLKEKPAGKLQAGKVIKITPIAELRAQALAGDLRAQFQMGLKAINGADGLKRNPLMAEKWWLRAAKQGHGFAQMNLGVIYSRGNLGEKDPAKAYRWAKLSLTRGNQRAQQLVDKLEKELNPQQIAEADAFVKAFKPVPEKAGGVLGAIRAGLPNYPVLTPNTDPKKIKFDTVNMNRTSVKSGDLWYDGFRFAIPKEGGELVWAFKGPIKSWYIMPLKGRMDGFRFVDHHTLKRDVLPMGKTGDKVVLQTLPAENLKAGEEYVIWFSFTKQVPVPVYISLNIFAGNSPGTKAIAEALDKAANLVKEPAEKKEEISAEDIIEGKLEVIQTKLKAGANPDFFIYPKRKGTVLHAAVSKGTIEVVKLILAGGAKPNPLNWLGKTPLDRLHESNEKKEPAERMAPEAFAAMETLLRKHGAKRSAQLNEGEPAAPEPKAEAKKAGTVLWEFETRSFVSSSPAIGSDGTVYVGSWDKKFYAINGKSGVKLWEFETRWSVTSSPAIGSDGTVYVGSRDKKLYAINGKSGVKLWEFETGSFVTSSPAIGSDGTLYVGSLDNNLYALSGKTGAKLWEFKTGDGVGSSPAIGPDGTVYVGSRDKKLYALSGKNGVKLWEFETGDSVTSSPAIGSDGTVYVGSRDKKLYALSGKTGIKLWEFETGGEVTSSPAIGSDGTVYVGSHDKKLYAINPKSGVKLWEFETGNVVNSSPAIGSDGTVYVGSNDTKLYAINGKSGVKLWEFETGSFMNSSPTIGSDGTLYVGSDDKKLYAINTESLGPAKSPWPMRGQNPQHTGRVAGAAAAPVVKPEPAKPEPAKPEPKAEAKKAATAIKKGLIAYYPFNGNARDEAGHGHDGAVVGATLTADRHGKPNSAYLFKPRNYIKVEGLMGKPKNVTLSAWARLAKPHGVRGADIVSLGLYVTLRLDNSEYKSTRGAGGIFYAGKKPGHTWQHLMDGKFYANTGWHHLVCTFDDVNNKQVVYLDGKQIRTAEDKGPIVYEGLGKDSYFGKCSPSSGNIAGSTGWDFRGVIDDIRIYDRALSSEEVEGLFLIEKSAEGLKPAVKTPTEKKEGSSPSATEPAVPEPEPAKSEPAKPDPAEKAKKPGTVLWDFETGGKVFSSPAIGSDGTVYVGSNDNKLYALDGKTGAKKLEFETGGSVGSTPAIGSDGTVYVGSIDKKLYALSGKSGVKLWEFETGDWVFSSPAIGSDGTVYVGSYDKKLYAINPKSGVKLWEFETGGDVFSSPAIGPDGTVYVGSWDKKLYAINGKSGVKLWEFETGHPVESSPAIGSDGTVYVGSDDKKLYAINPKSGVKLWEFKTEGLLTSSPAIGSDGTVYVGSHDKKLYAINPKSGVKLWEFETGGGVSSSPAIGSDGTVYVGSGYGDNKLYAINPKSGVKLWEFKTEGLLASSPAIGSDGTVYVGSHDKKLYAIKTDSKGLAKSPWPMRGQNARHTGRATAVAEPPVVKTEPAKPEPAAPAKKF